MALPAVLQLTGTGEAVITRASKIIQSVDDLQNELQDRRLARVGTVRLGVVPNLIPSLSPLLAKFLESRPMASFSIETGSSTVLMALLQDGALDLILAARVESTNEDVVQLPLPPVHLEIVARTEYARRAKFRTLADLSGERWLLPARSLYLRQLLDERFASSGLPAPQVTVEVAATPMAFTELLRKSDLLSILPSQMLQQAEGVGLTALAGQGMSSQHDLAILWRAGGYLSPICQDFRDAVAQWNQTSLA